MKHSLLISRAMLLAASCALLQHASVVSAAQSADAALLAGMRATTSASPPMPQSDVAARSDVPAMPDTEDTHDRTGVAGDVQGSVQGNVAELTRMIHDAKLSELRTTYNGSYGASLFFYPQEVTYYVALFQDKHFWRVLKSENADRAEAIYADFARQTAQLADVEIRRLQLQAQKAYIEDIIVTSQESARRLQADLDVAHTQQAKVDDYQRQAQGEAVTLHAEQEKARAQLRQVQGEVMELQRRTELGLPKQK
ncbi:putative exported lipoprotein [Paraburkholderia ribeironis]|uniref:Putative exported lipoprotein n=1 Tax=Paraburkholderia ribeironis TaxID=1247936 RepID=A0A1N7RYY0_9BURK|nr:DUF2968 domain-containing protein [Paraburkholderia ribeironis]SIT40271.1 putative exported lipoprotein [Paraburkholderia ribeironis]